MAIVRINTASCLHVSDGDAVRRGASYCALQQAIPDRPIDGDTGGLRYCL
jgi:hypothetical protein